MSESSDPDDWQPLHECDDPPRDLSQHLSDSRHFVPAHASSLQAVMHRPVPAHTPGEFPQHNRPQPMRECTMCPDCNTECIGHPPGTQAPCICTNNHRWNDTTSDIARLRSQFGALRDQVTNIHSDLTRTCRRLAREVTNYKEQTIRLTEASVVSDRWRLSVDREFASVVSRVLALEQWREESDRDILNRRTLGLNHQRETFIRKLHQFFRILSLGVCQYTTHARMAH